MLDLDSLETVLVAEADSGAGAVAVDPSRGTLVCVNFIVGSVMFYDAATGERTAELQLATGACAIGLVPERGEAFVANSLTASVSRIRGSSK